MSAREVLFVLNIFSDSELYVTDKGREESLGSHFVVQPLHSVDVVSPYMIIPLNFLV